MENEKSLSPEESLELISNMISKTKDSVADNTFYFLFWGWLVFGCCLANYVMKVYYHFPFHFYVWFLMPLGGLVSWWYGARQSRKKRVKSFVDDVLDLVWSSLGLTFFIVIFINILGSKFSASPFTSYILLYAIGTLITGRILRFTPLIIGGLFNFLLAIISVKVNYDNQLLLGALAIFTSYIVPGHLLRMRHQSKNS